MIRYNITSQPVHDPQRPPPSHPPPPPTTPKTSAPPPRPASPKSGGRDPQTSKDRLTPLAIIVSKYYYDILRKRISLIFSLINSNIKILIYPDFNSYV